MEVTREPDGRLRLELDLTQGRKLAKDVTEHLEDMPGALLDLANLLQSAYYEAQDEFRQPPHAFEPGARHPDSV